MLNDKTVRGTNACHGSPILPATELERTSANRLR
jgi:hypothetical protein